MEIEARAGTLEERIAAQTLTFVGVNEAGYFLYSDLGIEELSELYQARLDRELITFVVSLYGYPTV